MEGSATGRSGRALRYHGL